MADPVFIVKFEKGLADRHRLPLGHVLSILEEVRQMIGSVGREIQRGKGIENPTGDFGLELLAGRDGIVFKKGSVQAQIAITRDIDAGMLAANSVLSTVQKLSREKIPAGQARLRDPVEHKVVRYLDRIAKIQTADKTETRFIIKQNPAPDAPKKGPHRSSAVLGDTAIRSVRSFRDPAFITDNVTVYGRLFQLKDRNQEVDSKKFWGELRLDNGDVWRVQFDSEKQAEVEGLFRKQVCITGRAYYFEAYPTKIVPDSIDLDEERDYEAAFDELYGSAKGQLGGSFEELLKEMHGE